MEQLVRKSGVQEGLCLVNALPITASASKTTTSPNRITTARLLCLTEVLSEWLHHLIGRGFSWIMVETSELLFHLS